MNGLMILVLVWLSVAFSSEEAHGVYSSDCPLWTYRRNATSPCQCGTTAGGIIKCNLTSGVLSLHVCVCLTYDHSSKESVVGYCPYSCVMNYNKPVHVLPVTNSSFNDSCTVWNREGPLCSTCKPGYGIPIYTYYDLECVKCPHFQLRNLFRFLAISLLPPTILFILVTAFHLRVLHPPWNVFVLLAQMYSAPIIMQSALNIRRLYRYRDQEIVLKITATIFGPWNLDFFKAVYTPECISPGINTLQSYIIDGLIGLYPLVMLILLYMLVALRDRGFRVAIAIHRLFSRFRSSLNLRSSLIDTFATFYLLLYMKIGFAGLYVLAGTWVWSPDGSYVLAVCADPSIAYFGPSHVGYAITSILLELVVVVFPTLLLLFYPFLWFQRLLNYCNLRSLALNAFVDAFQGCYKDGTNGTRDYRFFSALQLVLRLTLPVAFFTTKESILSLYMTSVVLGIYISAFVICRPYKSEVYNKTDVIILMMLLVLAVQENMSRLLHAYNYRIGWITTFVESGCVVVPLFYLVIWIFIHLKPIIMRQMLCRQYIYKTYGPLLSHTE